MGFRVCCLGFRVWGLGFVVWGLRFGDLGFRVQGFCWASGLVWDGILGLGVEGAGLADRFGGFTIMWDPQYRPPCSRIPV